MARAIFVVAGEPSGDALGGNLLKALRGLDSGYRFAGVGGPSMEAFGLVSLFPMSDISVMGIIPVILRLRLLLRRIRQTADAVIASEPSVLVLIDSPDFTHRVAKLVRRARPKIPIIHYVSPTVWAWRPGRAKAMRPYIDHLLALLPFEPTAHLRLGGPPCTYVGHPLIDRMDLFEPHSGEQGAPTLLVLPGSRRSEVSRLMPIFGEALAIVSRRYPHLVIKLPAVAHLRTDIVELMADWPVKAEIVDGEIAKYTAFRSARAALAASGTVTLELALARIPMVVAYKATSFEKFIFDQFVNVPSVILPNLITGTNAVPEFLQNDCRSDVLADAVAALLVDGPARSEQQDSFNRLRHEMQVGQLHPSFKAAEIVARYANGSGNA